jgi:hypothetical protein
VAPVREEEREVYRSVISVPDLVHVGALPEYIREAGKNRSTEHPLLAWVKVSPVMETLK